MVEKQWTAREATIEELEKFGRNLKEYGLTLSDVNEGGQLTMILRRSRKRSLVNIRMMMIEKAAERYTSPLFPSIF